MDSPPLPISCLSLYLAHRHIHGSTGQAPHTGHISVSPLPDTNFPPFSCRPISTRRTRAVSNTLSSKSIIARTSPSSTPAHLPPQCDSMQSKSSPRHSHSFYTSTASLHKLSSASQFFRLTANNSPSLPVSASASPPNAYAESTLSSVYPPPRVALYFIFPQARQPLWLTVIIGVVLYEARSIINRANNAVPIIPDPIDPNPNPVAGPAPNPNTGIRSLNFQSLLDRATLSGIEPEAGLLNFGSPRTRPPPRSFF